MDQAVTGAERQKINNEYGEIVQERARLKDGTERGGQQKGNPQQGKGHSLGLGEGPGNKQVEKPPEFKSGPYGDKNKPQKQGK